MTKAIRWSSIAAVLIALTANPAPAQQMSSCVENSPERRGEVGCSIIESKVLPIGLKEPVFWHIDRFDSPGAARAAVAPASVAFDAAGSSWLMTIESQTSDHHGGMHIAEVGPLPLPAASNYAMNVISSAFTPGMYSTAHHHSGVEAFYVLEGKQCLETPTSGSILRKGDALAVPTGMEMRLLVTGSSVRRQLAVIVHDAAQPPTMRMEQGAPALMTCS
jgi:quercetin dioxygenase-like cupin family protein